MEFIIENYALPESGQVEIKIDRAFEIKVTAAQAQRKVDRWLLEFVSVIMGADPPTLVVGERAVWRVPAHISFPNVGHAGVVGTVEVDVETGDMLDNTEEKAEQFHKCGADIESGLPPYQPHALPPEYLEHLAQQNPPPMTMPQMVESI